MKIEPKLAHFGEENSDILSMRQGIVDLKKEIKMIEYRLQKKLDNYTPKREVLTEDQVEKAITKYFDVYLADRTV